MLPTSDDPTRTTPRLSRLELLRGDGVWKVVGVGVRIETRVLAWAALDALTLAEMYGAVVELGEGVPEDALAQGRRLAEVFDRSRYRSET
jgi:hypothetical protein